MLLSMVANQTKKSRRLLHNSYLLAEKSENLQKNNIIMPPKVFTAISRISSDYKATARAKFGVGLGFVVFATLVAQIIVKKKIAKSKIPLL